MLLRGMSVNGTSRGSFVVSGSTSGVFMSEKNVSVSAVSVNGAMAS